jgi:Tfp pilus assembly protein PilP
MLFDSILVSQLGLEEIDMRQTNTSIEKIIQMIMPGLTVLIAVSVCIFAGVHAQEMDQPPEPEIQAGPDIPRAPTPIPVEERQFLYTGQGTRDPFVPLTIHRDVDPTVTGLAGMSISEITILGIQIGLGEKAMVRGSDGKAYNMEVGQAFLDGKVVSIEPGKVVFERIIRDSFGREVDKETIEYDLHR